MKTYLVVGPERMTYDATYSDPPEYGSDCIEIQANNKRDAVMLAVREFLTQRGSTAADNRSDGLPPWCGYRAEEVSQEYVADMEAHYAEERVR